ncbi:glycosyltransferase family 4 protein [Acinetobacter johnsonii]|uniref:glycosyltransferase family 4 protein n=1 Tax=Acinetobacter johnsonii TaxID=40214 RepID=UPI0021672F75|nr:glycosyltransferase family 4 protein [Acinetobacter johnsonii]MCS3525542.1 glycosyltransferase involved in cell wall biosynthesis [Acinetobacter johnsonii]
MQKKKTILVLASTYPRWASDHEPRFIHELCKRLTTQFNIIALVPDAKDADINGFLDCVEVIRYRYAPRKLQTLVNNGGIVNNLRTFWWKWFLVPSFLLNQYLMARKVLNERKIDLIHAHWLIPQGWIAHSLSKQFNIPFIVTSHGGDLFGLQGNILRQIKKRVAEDATAITVVSQAMKYYLDQISIHPKILEVIPMGVELQHRFTPNPNIQRHKNELLFVGRLVPKKGLNLLLDALSILVRTRPELSLKIVGFGPEETSLKEQVKKLKLEKNVKFLGALSQDKLPALYQQTTLFVAPFVRADNGDQEGLPVALMEAIGCGCPVVVGHVSGLEDLLGEDIKYIAVNPHNKQDLIAAISAALDKPILAAERAIRIRQNVIKLIDWESVAFAYAKILEASIKNSPRA